MFKDSILENKKKQDFEKKQRLKALCLRNKFLGEWASSILGLKYMHFKSYVKQITTSELINSEYKNVIKKIELDFQKNNIKIAYNEIEFKVKEFHMKANVIVENKFKLTKFNN